MDELDLKYVQTIMSRRGTGLLCKDNYVKTQSTLANQPICSTNHANASLLVVIPSDSHSFLRSETIVWKFALCADETPKMYQLAFQNLAHASYMVQD